jgi:prepilin-type N-terminal cleavage/methylation domain-containing protein
VSPAKTRAFRGVTLLELMATMTILLVGIAATMTLVTYINRSNRRTLTATQAQIIAERTLENILALGCTADPPCSNLSTLDRQVTTVYQTASGELREDAPLAGTVARVYEVAVDVDNAANALSLENDSAGEPAVNRNLAGTQRGNVANVRVSVSWTETEREGRQVVVLQTRMAP